MYVGVYVYACMGMVSIVKKYENNIERRRYTYWNEDVNEERWRRKRGYLFITGLN